MENPRAPWSTLIYHITNSFPLRLSDLFTGHMKAFVLVMISGFCVCTFWFLLLSHSYIKFNAGRFLESFSRMDRNFGNMRIAIIFKPADLKLWRTSEMKCKTKMRGPTLSCLQPSPYHLGAPVDRRCRAIVGPSRIIWMHRAKRSAKHRINET